MLHLCRLGQNLGLVLARRKQKNSINPLGSYANDQNSQALAVLHVGHEHAARRAQELAQRAKQEIATGDGLIRRPKKI